MCVWYLICLVQNIWLCLHGAIRLFHIWFVTEDVICWFLDTVECHTKTVEITCGKLEIDPLMPFPFFLCLVCFLPMFVLMRLFNYHFSSFSLRLTSFFQFTFVSHWLKFCQLMKKWRRGNNNFFSEMNWEENKLKNWRGRKFFHHLIASIVLVTLPPQNLIYLYKDVENLFCQTYNTLKNKMGIICVISGNYSDMKVNI